MITKEMALAEAKANVLWLQQLVKDLSCDVTPELAAKQTDPMASVALRMIIQIREQVLAYETKHYIIG